MHKKITNFTYNSLVTLLAEQKKISTYLMDGIVLDVDDLVTRKALGFETNSINPKYARAFKVRTKEDEYKTVCTGIDLNVSKNGLLKPRVLLQRVVINGVNVTAATGKNARTLITMGIGVGAELIITRSGDAIPDILYVTKKADPNLPTHCPSCGEKLEWTEPSASGERKDLICLNEDCEGRVYKRLLAFFRGIGTEEFNKGAAQKCLDAGYDSFDKVLRMKEKDFLTLEGFGTRSAQTLCANIKTACESTSLAKIMHSTGFFGRSLGSTKLGDILDAFGEDETLNMANKDKNEVITKVSGLPYFEYKTSELFADGIITFNTWWQVNKDLFVTDTAATVISDIFAGQNILFTGFREKNLATKIIENGGLLAGSISKKVTLLVTKDVNSSSGKLKKAKLLNIPIMSLEDFIQKLNN